MAAIFISYRRSDSGWASWLNDHLVERFDVFFDTDKIDYGDKFPDIIEEALNECRIFLVIIGRTWSSQKNLKRLFDKKDWVRREIETCLNRTGVRIVPVLMGDADIPSSDEIPETLHDLTDCNAVSLSPEKRKTDLKLLMHKLDKWLSGSAYRTSTRKNIPPIIPHLCNRISQEDEFVDVMTHSQKGSKNPIVILHGHKWEEHFGFLDRLRYRHILDEVLGIRNNDVGIALSVLQWNVRQAAKGDYEKVLFTAIKRNVLDSLTADDQDVHLFFRSIRQPYVLVLQVTYEDYQICGKGLFKGLIKAWQKIFQFGSIDTSSTTTPPFAVLLWINVTYEDYSQNIAFENLSGAITDSTCSALPVLKPLREGDLQAWIALNDVKHHVAGLEHRVLAIIENERLCVASGKIHMRFFIEAIREILS